MNNFLSPKKIKFVIMFILIILISFILGIFFTLRDINNVSGHKNFTIFNILIKSLYLLLIQIGWPLGGLESMGLDLSGTGNDFYAFPNFLGWIFVVLSFVIFLFSYYILACLIYKFFKRKDIKRINF